MNNKEQTVVALKSFPRILNKNLSHARVCACVHIKIMGAFENSTSRVQFN